MKILKKVIAMTLTAALLFTCAEYQGLSSVQAASVTADDWKKNAIVSPTAGGLVGAGYIDIKWNSELENAKSYKVYIDNSLKKTVNDSAAATMSCEFYTVSVSAHTAYIVATMKDNSTVTSNKITFYVTKKGIGVNDKDMGQSVKSSALNLGWYYNWGYKSFKETKYRNTSFYNTEYVPMIWGSGVIKEAAFESIKANGYKYILGYNEPDLQWEANMPVNTVVNRWSEFCATGLRLGSPATATIAAWSDTWFKPFMQRINSSSNLKVDFVAAHCYWESDIGSNTAALQFLEAVDQTYAMYGKPIWVTEFAVAGNKHFDYKDAKALKGTYNFMKVVLEGLNARPYVERYAWFSFSTDESTNNASASALFDYKTGALTTLGKLYADMGNPAGYKGASYNSYTKSGVNTSAAACQKKIKTTLYTARSRKKRQIKLTIKKVNNAKGYQIQYSRYKSMKKKKTKVSKKAKYTIKKLKRKKKYYVRVRAYKVLNKKKLYCAWSKKIRVKVK